VGQRVLDRGDQPSMNDDDTRSWGRTFAAANPADATAAALAAAAQTPQVQTQPHRRRQWAWARKRGSGYVA